MVWVHSQHGVPWTASKMRRARTELREGASLGFAFGADPHEKLTELWDKVLSQRPDLVLHVWSTRSGKRLSSEDLAALTGLRQLRRLELSGFSNKTLSELAQLKALTWLTIRGSLKSLAFLESLSKLQRLSVVGAVPDLSPIGACGRLRTLLLQSATLRSLGFVEHLPRLQKLVITGATVECDLAPLCNVPKLTELSVSSNRNLRDAAFLERMTRLQSLRFDQPLVKELPSLARLTQLRDVHFQGMKAWSNPEALESLPRVRSIVLREINPKLDAERFFFLAHLKGLRHLDVRWIDYGKRRREKLDAYLREHVKPSVLPQ